MYLCSIKSIKHIAMNTKKLITSKVSDMDSVKSIYPIKCEQNNTNLNRLNKVAENRSWRQRGFCCEHDCCGHLIAENYSVHKAGNKGYNLIITQSYNY